MKICFKFSARKATNVSAIIENLETMIVDLATAEAANEEVIAVAAEKRTKAYDAYEEKLNVLMDERNEVVAEAVSEMRAADAEVRRASRVRNKLVKLLA